MRLRLDSCEVKELTRMRVIIRGVTNAEISYAAVALISMNGFRRELGICESLTHIRCKE